MTPEVVVTIYCVLIVAASLIGGWLPRWLRLTHSGMQVAISFVAGVLLGIGILHLLPHGFYEWQEVDSARAMDRSVWWFLLGFLGTFLLQRLFHFHTHEAPDDLAHGGAGECDHEHASAHHGGRDSHGRDGHGSDGHHQRFTWGGVFFGLTVHSLVDGLTLGAAVAAESSHAEPALLAGFGVFLAVLLHKPFDSLSITSLMLARGWSDGWRTAINLIYALTVPVGVLLFHLGLQQAGDSAAALLGGTLTFAAGACVCIASSDLLPELQFHSHDRLKLSAALVLGLALAWGLVYLENQGHDYHHSAQHEHGHRHAHD
jgi:zinc and cadmium transporter